MSSHASINTTIIGCVHIRMCTSGVIALVHCPYIPISTTYTDSLCVFVLAYVIEVISMIYDSSVNNAIVDSPKDEHMSHTLCNLCSSVWRSTCLSELAWKVCTYLVWRRSHQQAVFRRNH